jgi:hypothetical protein
VSLPRFLGTSPPLPTTFPRYAQRHQRWRGGSAATEPVFFSPAVSTLVGLAGPQGGADRPFDPRILAEDRARIGKDGREFTRGLEAVPRPAVTPAFPNRYQGSGDRQGGIPMAHAPAFGTGSDPSTVDRTCGSRPCQPSPKAENAKERAPRVGGDALSNPPGCGKWVGHHYNAPTSWRFQGSKEKEARPLSAAPPPAQAAARCAAELQICRLPANRFIPSDHKRGLQVCDRGRLTGYRQ